MDVGKATRGILDAREKAGQILAKAELNPLELSEQMDRMSLYNTYIGDELGKIAEQRETAKARAYLKYLEEGKSATAADNLARAEVAELTGQEKKLELLHDDVWQYTSRIQSRLRRWENEHMAQKRGM